MIVSGNVTSRPVQKIPLKNKTKEWKEDCVKYYVSKERTSSDGVSIKLLYDLYNGIYDENDLQYVVNPYKVKEGFPASMHNFNIIKPKIDLLIGELSKRPDSFRVFNTGEGAVSKIQEEKVNKLKQYIISKAREGWDNLDQDARLAEIENYFRGSYVDEAEETGYHTLQYLKEKLGLNNELLKGFKDGIIADLEVHYQGIVNGEPYAERINPKYFTPDEDPDLENIEDGEYCILRIPMTLSAIHDRFKDILTDAQFSEISEKLTGYSGSSSKLASDVNYAPLMRTPPAFLSGGSDNPEHMIDVWHVQWRSFKRIGFTTIEDESGQPSIIMIDENYVPKEGEEIDWEWVSEIWEGYLIGDDMYVGIQPVENQYYSLENPQEQKLNYIGSRYNSTNTTSKSLVAIMKPLQYMYIILWYRLELALARDKGKVFIMDLTQIPKDSGFDVQTWLHYLSNLGIAFVNPYEKGWDIPDRDGGRPSSFNTFQAADLTMSNTIGSYVQLMMKVEEMIGEISGVSKQRQGAISSDELVGNVNRAVIQSSHITENLFWTHNDIKKRLYNALINTAKVAWANSGKTKLYYIMDDSNRAFLDVGDDFYYSDLGVFVSDSTRENLNLEHVRGLLQPAMQNGATLLDAVTILTSDSMAILKQKLRTIEDGRMKAAQAQQEAENSQAQQELQLKQEQLRIQEEDSIRKAETSMLVAEMRQNNQGGEELSIEDNSMEQTKLELERDKFLKELELKKAQLEEVKRVNRVSETQKNEEISIKRKQSNNKPKTNK